MEGEGKPGLPFCVPGDVATAFNIIIEDGRKFTILIFLVL